MLDESFEKIYRAFRLEYYKHFFSVLRERAGSLSAAEMLFRRGDLSFE